MTTRIPTPVWIAAAVIAALIALALFGYLSGWWEPAVEGA
jgi:hypothetical protein